MKKILFLLVFGFLTSFQVGAQSNAKIKINGSAVIENTVEIPAVIGQSLSVSVRYENTIGDDLSIDGSPTFSPGPVPDSDLAGVSFAFEQVGDLNPFEEGVSWSDVSENFTNLGEGELRVVETTFEWKPTNNFGFFKFSVGASTVGDDDGSRSVELIIVPAPANASIPTLSEWGIVFFVLLMLNLGLLTLKQAQIVSIDGTVSMPATFTFPFEKIYFLEGLKQAALLGLLSIGLIFLGWGEFTLMDSFGLTMSTLLLAYLLHLRKV